MTLFLVSLLLSVIAFVSSEKQSCVCDCDPGPDRPNKPWATTLYPDRPYTERPYTERPYPDRPNRPDKPFPDRPSSTCRCLREHRIPHLFCGSREDQLIGNCRPNALYTCGPKSMEAVVYKTCRTSCIEMIYEDQHGMDSCRNDLPIALNADNAKKETQQ